MLEIDQLFTKKFIDSNFGLPIAHENLDYIPTIGTAYAEIFVIQNDKTPFSVSSSDETDGIFRVILRYPVKSSSIAAKAMADTIFNVFKIGSRHDYTNTRVTISAVGRDQGVKETGWYKLVLSIRYKAFIRR